MYRPGGRSSRRPDEEPVRAVAFRRRCDGWVEAMDWAAGLLGEVEEDEKLVWFVAGDEAGSPKRRIVCGHCCRVLAKNGFVTPIMTGGGPWGR